MEEMQSIGWRMYRSSLCRFASSPVTRPGCWRPSGQQSLLTLLVLSLPFLRLEILPPPCTRSALLNQKQQTLHQLHCASLLPGYICIAAYSWPTSSPGTKRHGPRSSSSSRAEYLHPHCLHKAGPGSALPMFLLGTIWKNTRLWATAVLGTQ